MPVVLVVAAVGKLLAWDEFEGSLASFHLVSPGLRRWAAVIVPGAEAAGGVLLLCGRRRCANLWALALLGLFSSVVLWHWMNNVEPSCACLGLWSKHHEGERSARSMLTRNAVLIAIASAGAIAARRVTDGSSPSNACEAEA